MSEVLVDKQEAQRMGRTALPRFSRILLGSRRRISLENWRRRDEGSREVVMRIFGSTMPESVAYSSSTWAASSPSASRDSSYLKSFRSWTSSTISFGSG